MIGMLEMSGLSPVHFSVIIIPCGEDWTGISLAWQGNGEQQLADHQCHFAGECCGELRLINCRVPNHATKIEIGRKKKKKKKV